MNKVYCVSVLFLLLFGCSQGKKENSFKATKEKLIPLHQKMGKIQAGEWLETHPERNLTLKEYMHLPPVRPDAVRKKIYIQPIGNFTAYEILLIQLTAEYLEAFYGLKTVIQKNWDPRIVPKKNRRIVQYLPIFNKDSSEITGYYDDTSAEQLQTQYILHELLKPQLPKDASVMIGLCDKDLYPDTNWNYVFGQASLLDRVGVWSFFRFGDPSNPNQFKEVLLRTLKVACHETGHMFSIKHCSRYKCIMNGSNHLDEADGKPTWLCPDCLEKFCWNFNIDPKKYFERLREFWKKNDMKEIVAGYDRFIKAIE